MKKPRPVLIMDSDKLGLAAGAFCATLVMAVGFFYTQLTGWEVAFRTVVTFAVVYAVTFVFVRVLLATAPIPHDLDSNGSRGDRGDVTDDMGDRK
jgi:hypothetical protein